jgi:hypothetical protein
MVVLAPGVAPVNGPPAKARLISPPDDGKVPVHPRPHGPRTTATSSLNTPGEGP